MSDFVLELKGITKIFPGVKALNNVQFQLKKGEVHALMGENGAGKSTFIKVITGVHKAEEGEMFLDGQKVDFKGPRDAQAAGIAAVYQHPTSYPDLSVAENIFMGHEIIKNGMIQWKKMNEEAAALLNQLNADFKSTDEMGALSVAQQQMVEIAKALSTNARIIILDEPTAMLDPNGRKEVIRAVRALNHAEGITVVLITHYMEEIIHADKAVVMDKGHVAMQGTPREIFSQVEKLKELRLDVPQVTLLAYELKKSGIDLPDGILTCEELIEALHL